MELTYITDINKNRRALFSIFTHVFADVPYVQSDELIFGAAKLLFMLAEGSENACLIEGAERIKVIFEEPAEKTLLDRQRDYTQLFLTGRFSVPINESVYLSSEKLLKQEPWSQVKKIYCEHFFKVSEGCTLMEDHISIELSFLGFLSDKIEFHLENNNYSGAEKLLNVQYSFYKGHLSRWIPLFSDFILGKNDKLNTEFYPAMVRLLKGFQEEDLKLLEGLI